MNKDNLKILFDLLVQLEILQLDPNLKINIKEVINYVESLINQNSVFELENPVRW